MGDFLGRKRIPQGGRHSEFCLVLAQAMHRGCSSPCALQAMPGQEHVKEGWGKARVEGKSAGEQRG